MASESLDERPWNEYHRNQQATRHRRWEEDDHKYQVLRHNMTELLDGNTDEDTKAKVLNALKDYHYDRDQSRMAKYNQDFTLARSLFVETTSSAFNQGLSFAAAQVVPEILQFPYSFPANEYEAPAEFSTEIPNPGPSQLQTPPPSVPTHAESTIKMCEVRPEIPIVEYPKSSGRFFILQCPVCGRIFSSSQGISTHVVQINDEHRQLLGGKTGHAAAVNACGILITDATAESVAEHREAQNQKVFTNFQGMIKK